MIPPHVTPIITPLRLKLTRRGLLRVSRFCSSREYPSEARVGVAITLMRQNEVLLARRGREPAKGLWSLPGGKIELGETVEEAAQREMMEETGLKVDFGPHPVFVTTSAIKRDKAGLVQYHFVILHALGILSDDTNITAVPGDDVDELKWLNVDHLLNIDRSGNSEVLSGLEVVPGTSGVIERARLLIDSGVLEAVPRDNYVH